MIHHLKPFASLKFKQFALYYYGSVLSEIGSQMQVVAINWQIYQITKSAGSLGLVGLAGFAAVILLSLPAGLLVDKHDRKQILIYSQLFPCLVSLIMTVLTYTELINPIWLYFLVFLTFAARTFQGPSRQSIIPQLVPKEYYVNAFSLQTMSRQISLVIGPAIGGFMIAWWGVGSIYLVNAVSFIFFIATLLPLQIRTHAQGEEVELAFSSIWEGVKFVFNNKIMFYTMALDFIANFFSSATTLLPVFASEIFKIGPEGLGLLYAAPAIGSTIAGLVMGSLGSIKNQGKIILGAVFLYGLGTTLFGFTTSFIFGVIFLSLLGVGDMVSTILRSTLRQLITPDHLRGRMIGVNMLFVQGGPMLGEAEAGFVAQLYGTPFSVISGGVITMIAVAYVAFQASHLRNYHNHKLTPSG